MKLTKSSKLENLTIVGAGPKALAVGLRAHVYREFGYQVPQVTIVEKSEIAAHWTGNHGFTNGQLSLGTSPEKDLGFPYENDGSSMSIRIQERLQNFSWRSYLIREGLYAKWVDRGSPQPTHQQWGNYLKFVANAISSSVNFVNAEVTKAQIDGSKWKLELKAADRVTHIATDALMLTGPAVPKIPTCLESDQILNMQSVWTGLSRISKVHKVKIAVVGNGETAASVLIALNKKDFPLAEVDVIAPQGAIFTRGESFLENRFYSTSHLTHWKKLSAADRLNFIRRTDIGVFSPAALAELRYEDFNIVAGRATCARKNNDRVEIDVDYNSTIETRAYDTIVFASGLNHKKLLEKIIDAESLKKFTSNNVVLEENIQEDLSVKDLNPKLYLPMLAGLEQGPGFANLSCLGLLASRILDPLVEKQKTITKEYNETRYRLHTA